MQIRALQKHATVRYVNGIGRLLGGGWYWKISPGSVGALCRAFLFPGGLEAVAREHANHEAHHKRCGVTSEGRMWTTEAHHMWWQRPDLWHLPDATIPRYSPARFSTAAT